MLNPIKNVSLVNFGRYQDAQFEFAPGLNIIRGPNRSGKTWILRGISAALCNTGRFNADDPAKDELRFFDGKDIAPHYSVDVEFADGLKIGRYRDRSLNMYRIGGKEYDKVGRGFFEPVGDATNIFPTSLDGRPENAEVINIKLLSDARFFLLGRNDLDRNRILTRLVGMDVVEEAERATVKDLTQVNRELSDAKSGVAEQQAIVDKYTAVPLLADTMVEATSKISDAVESNRVADDGEGLLETKVEAVASLHKYSLQHQLLDIVVSTLQESLDEADKQYSLASVAEQLMATLQELETAVTTKATLSAVLGTAADLLGIALLAANEVLERVQAAEDVVEEQHSLAKTIATAETDIGVFKRNIANGEKKYNQLLHEYGVCPVCGQGIDAEHKCGGLS